MFCSEFVRGDIVGKYDSICYKNYFLDQVIIRCDFLEILENECLSDIEITKTILKGFPRKGKTQLVMFEEVNVDVSSEDILQSKAKRNTYEGMQIEFMDHNNNKVILSNKMLICEVNNYKTYEDITNRFFPIIHELFAKKTISVVRTGIRYINIFNNDVVKVRKNFFSNKIAESFEGKLPITIDGIECIRCMHLLEYFVNGMQLNFRYGMYNPEYPKTLKKNDFVLDYDCYTNELISNPSDLSKYINIGHDSIQTLFEKSITDSLREIYRHE